MRKNRAIITLSVWMTMLMITGGFSITSMANENESMPEWSFTFEQEQILPSNPGDGYKIKGTTLTIKMPGIYRVTGNCTEGNIVIDKNTSGVTLILEDLDLSCSSTSPLVCKKSTGVDLKVSGAVSLTDSENPANEDSADPDVADAFEGAAIKTKADSSLLIEGTGALTVDGSACKNGIKGSDGSAITISMKENGSVTVRTRNDGIAGDHINFLSGQFNITSDSDAVQADSSLTIMGGKYDIRTMNGYETKEFDPDTSSAKGLKSDNSINIFGGTFRLNTIDDAIHSDDTVRITGGTFTIDTGDDGINADNYLTLGDVKGLDRDPMVTINNCYEGLESARVSILNGKYSIHAIDDGINASSTLGERIDPEKHSISIYGGNMYLVVGGDGIDSNGTLDILGGNIEIWAMSVGLDNPLDYQTAMTVRNARVFAAGSAGTNLAKPSDNSQLYMNYFKQLSAGQKVRIQNGDTTLYNADVVKNAMIVFYSDPEWTEQSVLEFSTETNCETGNGFIHEWESKITVPATETANGIITYTCPVCGKTERQTILMTDPSLPTSEDGFKVAFAADGHSDAQVYRKVSDEAPGTLEAIVPKGGIAAVYCKDSADSGESGFLEIEIRVDNGYELAEVTASNETAVIKQSSFDEQANSFVYQLTDVTADTQITMKTKSIKPPSGGNVGGGGGGAVTPDPVPGDDPTPEPDDPDPTPDPVPEVLFEDVPDDAYYYDPVKWAVDNGVTNGIDETHFGPDLSCTRAQMVTFLWRAAGSPEPPLSQSAAPSDRSPEGGAGSISSFTDVPEDAYYYKAVLWAMEKEITNGTSETTFSPDMTVTRGQSVTFLYRFTGEKTDADIPFEDVEEGAYYEEAVQWAVSAEVTKGTSETTFEPESPCTRAQIVTFLYRAMAE